MLNMLLLGAQVGGSLFQARETTKSAQRSADLAFQQAGINAGQAVFGGEMERFQIRQQARYDESLRRRGFAQSIGSQRAASYGAGIIGGRTKQLIEARSQASFTKEMAQARFKEEAAISSSRFQQESRIQAARAGASNAALESRQVARQGGADLAGSLIGAGRQGYAIWEQNKAAEAVT